MSWAIVLFLRIGAYSDVVYLILGAVLGCLIGNLRKSVEVRGRNGETHSEKRWRKSFVFITILIGVFAVLLTFINRRYAFVPDVINLSYEEASARLHAAGLSCSENDGRYGDVVISVSPDSKYVKSGSTVIVMLGRAGSDDKNDTLSEDESSYDTLMPDLYLVQEQQAVNYLRNLGFTDVEIVPTFSETTVAGYVLRTDPYADEEVSYSDKIVLYVSVNEVE